MPDAATHAEIATVVRTYVEGMGQSDPEKLRVALHANTCSVGHYKGVLEWQTCEQFIAAVGATVKTADPAPWLILNSVSVVGDVATVQVEDNFCGEQYDHILTFLRHQGRWVIVSKVFFLGP